MPVLLAGDYNVVPTDADIYSLRSYADDAPVQPASRDAFRHLLAQGWIDALRTLHPDVAIYTFRDYMHKWERDARLRIDHLLLNAELAPRLVAAEVDKAVRGKAARAIMPRVDRDRRVNISMTALFCLPQLAIQCWG